MPKNRLDAAGNHSVSGVYDEVSLSTGSLSFNGSNQTLQIATNTAFDLGTTYTIEFWIYPNALGTNWGGILHKGFYTTGIDTWTSPVAFSIRGLNSVFRCYFYATTAANEQYIDTTIGPTVGAWNHVAVVRNGTSGAVYINGVAAGTITGLNTPSASTRDLKIGVWDYSASAEYFNGYLSNIRIIKGTALYTSAFTPPTIPLEPVTNTQLLLKSSNVSAATTDSSPNNFTVTNNNSVAFNYQSPFNDAPCGSLYFNGSAQRLTTSSSSIFDISGTPFTIEFWMYMTAFPSGAYNRLITIGPNNTTSSFVVQLSTTGQLNVGLPYGGTSSIPGSYQLALNTWYHVAVVYTSTTAGALYVNGVNVSSGSGFTAITSASNYFYVGYDTTGTVDAKFTGYVSNVRLTKSAVYTKNFTPTQSLLQPISNTSILLQVANSSAYITDSSTNATTVTNNGSIVYRQFAPITAARQRVDNTGNFFLSNTIDEVTIPQGSLNFNNAQSQYLSVAHSTALNITSGDFTIELWAYFNDVTNSGVILNKDGVFSASYPQYGIYVGSGTTSVDLGNGAGISPTVTNYSIGSVAVGQWYHIAVVRTGSTIKTFLNGVQGVSTTQGTAMSDGGKPLLIGIQSGFSNYFDGSISNLRILKGTALYTSSFTPPTAPLDPITNTSLLLKASSLATVITDSSATPATITNNNGVAFNYQGPFNNLPCGSIYFNGSNQYLSLASNAAFDQNTSFTLESWVFRNSGSAASGYFFAQLNNGYLCLQFNSSGQFVVDKSYVGTQITSSSTFALNTWHHVALCYDGTNTRLFVNGTLQGTVSGGGSASGATLTIGAYLTGTNYFPGSISNFRYVKGTALYTKGFTPPTTVLQPITNTSLLLQVANSSTFTTDSSTNAFTVTNNNTAVYKQFAPITSLVQRLDSSGNHSIEGVYDEVTLPSGSLYFDGSNQKLTVPASSNFAYGTGDFTIDGWMYPTSIIDTGNNGALLWSQTVSGTNYFNVVVNSSGQLAFLATTSGGGTPIFASGTFSFNTWNHFAVVRSSGVVTVYLNGVGGTPTSVTQNFSDTSFVPTIGQYTHSTQLQYAGYISNLRVVKGSALYTANFTPTRLPSDAVTNTQLLLKASSNSAYITDSSINNLTVTNTNNVRYNYQGPFNDQPCGSNYFGGNGNYVYTGTSANLDPGSTGAWSLELWVFPISSGNYYSHGNGAAYGNSLWLAWGQTANAFRFGQGNGSSANPVDFTTAGSYPANQWYHIAITKDSSNNIRMFVNGVLVNTITNMTSGIASTPRAILNGLGDNNGVGNSGGTFYLSGIRWVKGICLYTGSFTTPTNVFQQISNTQLLLQVVNSSAKLTDSSTNLFTFTTAGTTTYNQFAPLAN